MKWKILYIYKKKMPVHSYVVILLFNLFGAVFLYYYFRIRGQNLDILGKATLEKRYFFSGKIAVFTTWVLFILKAVNPSLGYLFLPDVFSWIAVGLLIFGILVVWLSFFYLGRALKVGLPEEATMLQTRGIYRFSRNPIYMGVYIVCLASCIYFPDLINVSFTLYGLYIHHLIIRQEERFLAGRFGADWMIYSARVSRYL